MSFAYSALNDVSPQTIGLTGQSTMGIATPYSSCGSSNGKYIYFSGKNNAGNNQIGKSSDYGFTVVWPFGGFPTASGYTNVSCNDLGDTVLGFSGNTV